MIITRFTKNANHLTQSGKNSMNGYDIDGVATAGVRPLKDEPAVYISGWLYTEFTQTVALLGTDHPIYLRPYGSHGDVQLAAIWKATMIDALKVHHFYEDDTNQIELMRRVIKTNCVIHRIVNGKAIN